MVRAICIMSLVVVAICFILLLHYAIRINKK